jgi:hypothetical protein
MMEKNHPDLMMPIPHKRTVLLSKRIRKSMVGDMTLLLLHHLLQSRRHLRQKGCRDHRHSIRIFLSVRTLLILLEIERIAVAAVVVVVFVNVVIVVSLAAVVVDTSFLSAVAVVESAEDTRDDDSWIHLMNQGQYLLPILESLKISLQDNVVAVLKGVTDDADEQPLLQ